MEATQTEGVARQIGSGAQFIGGNAVSRISVKAKGMRVWRAFVSSHFTSTGPDQRYLKSVDLRSSKVVSLSFGWLNSAKAKSNSVSAQLCGSSARKKGCRRKRSLLPANSTGRISAALSVANATSA